MAPAFSKLTAAAVAESLRIEKMICLGCLRIRKCTACVGCQAEVDNQPRYFCGRECQKRDWRVHRLFCGSVTTRPEFSQGDCQDLLSLASGMHNNLKLATLDDPSMLAFTPAKLLTGGMPKREARSYYWIDGRMDLPERTRRIFQAAQGLRGITVYDWDARADLIGMHTAKQGVVRHGPFRSMSR